MIIKPIPVVNKVYPNHITDRYEPVLVTITPATADSTEAPKENESILRKLPIRFAHCYIKYNAYSTPASVAEAPRT